MTHVEEEKVTTTIEEVDPPEPKPKDVTMINQHGDTLTVDETPDETGETRTTTTSTRTEVREPD
jgi:hypothetical protein